MRLFLVSLLFAAPQPLPGVDDHRWVNRFPGSVLYTASTEHFASVRLPAGPGKSDNGRLIFSASATIEGEVSGYQYVNPPGREPLEIFRSYVASLEKAGFKALYTCERAACEAALINERYRQELLAERKWDSRRNSPGGGSSPRELWFWAGKSTVNGADRAVVVWAAGGDSIWESGATTLVSIEAKPLELEQGLVNLEALQKGLVEEGRVTLGGLYFDTGLAVLKPESKPQLEALKQLFAATPSLKAFVVGHTDNQGVFDANLTLSQKRAEAVVAELVKSYGVQKARLVAKGVANVAPLAENVSAKGRARNRRVELVAQ